MFCYFPADYVVNHNKEILGLLHEYNQKDIIIYSAVLTTLSGHKEKSNQIT